MYHHGNARDVPACELGGYGRDGIADPRADFWVAVLVHGEIVSAGGQESRRGVDVAIEEDVVDGDSEEPVE